ncbi:MAG: Dihydrolipoyl dehydrogenase, partial [candidate division TA06 bacterium 34_109]
EVIKTSKVLLSVGRVPDFGGLDIQKLGIKLENGGIYVDSYMQTNIPHIYAVGDVTGKKMLAHVASRQGQVAIDHISGNSEPMSYQVVPFCVFSNPELASVGLNEKEANEKYDNIKVFRFPYRANGRALTMNEQEGYIKMIANTQNHRILGVHIIGAHASELIAEAALALQLGVTASDIANTIHAHPTLAEIIAETAEGILGYPIHVVR